MSDLYTVLHSSVFKFFINLLRLQVEELNAMAKENEKNPVVMPNSKFNGSTSTPLVCEHKEMEVPHFALGLCETCYKDVSSFFLA